MEQPAKRLVSLDALRGFDMLWIVGGEWVIRHLAKATDFRIFKMLSVQMNHMEWEGFHFYDLIMPLFLFMVGMSIPFSISKRQSLGDSSTKIYLHTIKRSIILFILGMVCQCNLLSFDSSQMFLIHDTLQAIAIGYLFSVFIYSNLKIRGQITITSVLLLSYWVIMQFFPVPGYEAGTCTHQINPARYIDRLVFGRFDDASADYTWVLSSLGFISTVMTGVFASSIVRAKNIKVCFFSSNNAISHKALFLFLTGITLVAAGQILNIWFPIIKRLWSVSFIFHSSGLSFLLFTVFYWIIDVKGYQGWAFWFKVIGMNSIAVYMAVHLISFDSIAHNVLFGLEQFTGDYYPLIRSIGGLSIIYSIMYWMYRKGTFIKI